MAELAILLLDKIQYIVANLVAIIYNISEQETPGEELNRELLGDLRRPSGKELNKELSNINPIPKAEELNRESAEGIFISNKDLLLQIRDSYIIDKLAQAVIAAKEGGHYKLLPVYRSAKIKLEDCKIVNSQLFIIKQLYIPDILELRIKIIKKLHTAKPAGYIGYAVTYYRLSSYYYWPGMMDTVQ